MCTMCLQVSVTLVQNSNWMSLFICMYSFASMLAGVTLPIDCREREAQESFGLICYILSLILLCEFNTEHIGPFWQEPDRVKCGAFRASSQT